MKSVLLSVKPQYVAKILNGEKTIEIRKKFPKDYVGWVYIYCTKNGHLTKCSNGIWYSSKHGKPYDSRFSYYSGYQGKVVARFWCDKVEELFTDENGMSYYTDTITKDYELSKLACIDDSEIEEYLNGKIGKAIHINNLEIFDKPKEIKEFRRYCDKHFNWWTNRCLDCKAYTPDTDIEDYCNENKLVLTKAPQSYCFIEV